VQSHGHKSTPTNTDQMLKQIRLSRILCGAVLLLCTVPLYLASNTFWDSSHYTRGCVLVSTWAILGALAAKVWLVPKRYTLKTVNLFCTVYWALLIAVFIPYMLGDAAANSLPFHTLLLCFLLIALPFGNTQNCVLHFILFGAAAVFGSLFGGGSLLHTIQCGFIAAAGLMLALYLNAQQSGIVAKLNTEARTDFLTGIPNRTGGMERLKKMRTLAAEQGKLLAVILVRVAELEKYADTFGRAAADEALSQVAGALKLRSKGKLSFIFRYDDDDFVLVQAVPGSEGYINGFAANCLQDIEDLRIAKSTIKDDYLCAVAGITFATPGDTVTDDITLIEQATDAARKAADTDTGFCIFEHKSI